MSDNNKLQCEGWNGHCDSKDAVRYRMNTQYGKDELNYRNLCPSCQKECDDHWKEMWSEFNYF